MKNIEKYLIQRTSDIYNALIKLNDVSTCGLTLFVIDENHRLEGSLTDGDIRRSIIKGLSLSDSVTSCMNDHPLYVLEGDSDNISKFRYFREKNIHAIPVIDKGKHIIDIYNMEDIHSALPIDAVLMAGGKGERLRPLTEHCPKPLLKVGDKSIIDYNVDSLIKNGVKNISVTVNYLREQIIHHFSDERKGIKIRCVEEDKFYGTMGAVKLVPSFENDSILVMNSDLFTNIDFEEFYLNFKEKRADMSVAVVPYSISIPYGILDVQGDNIVGMQEKPVYNYYANAGIYLIKKEFLKLIPQKEFFNATDLIDILIKQEKNVNYFPITGYWLDIGKKEEYQKACDLVKHIRK